MKAFDKETPKYQSTGTETPYVRAKQAWDARTEAFAIGAETWRKISFITAGLAVFLLILLLVSLSWHKPSLYVAEVSPGGQVMNVKLLSAEYHPTEAQEEYFITQFIKLIREVPLDPVAAKNNWLSAYHFLSTRGTKVLNAFFQQNNPLSLLNKKTVTVTINGINPISKNTYEVNWTEESVDQNGQLVGNQAMNGVFTVAVWPPSNTQQMLQNPLGIYITDFHMSPRVG